MDPDLDCLPVVPQHLLQKQRQQEAADSLQAHRRCQYRRSIPHQVVVACCCHAVHIVFVKQMCIPEPTFWNVCLYLWQVAVLPCCKPGGQEVQLGRPLATQKHTAGHKRCLAVCGASLLTTPIANNRKHTPACPALARGAATPHHIVAHCTPWHCIT
jgi:hypothetical protein